MAQSLRYAEFIQAVRRFRPTDLLPALAAHSAAREREAVTADAANWSPWAIAAIAKESALKGNEYRSASVESRDIDRLVHLLNASGDVIPDQSAASLIAPILYEQFPYQESIYEEMARTHALLVHNEPSQDPIDWKDLLGVGLDEAMRASHVLHAWVLSNGGRFDPAILDMPHFQEIYLKVAPRKEIETTANVLIADIAGLRQARAHADSRVTLPSRLERYAFNPLNSQPLVDLGEAGIWAPQTMLVARSFLGTNLYYRGVAKWGKRFADGLGDRTQRYVGRQLGLLSAIRVYPEIEYAKSQNSVDWILVAQDAVILVECKAARLTLDAQAGGDTLSDVMQRYIGAARKQIDRTAALIRADHAAFVDIPKDLPVVGIITTAEQFYLAGTPFSGFTSTGDVPVTVLSLRDLEFLVCLPEREATSLVLEHVHPEGEGGRFGGAFSDEQMKLRNPILEAAWNSFDFLAEASDS